MMSRLLALLSALVAGVALLLGTFDIDALPSDALQRWHARGRSMLVRDGSGRAHVVFYACEDRRPEGQSSSSSSSSSFSTTIDVLLLLHGFPSSSFEWHNVWPRVNASFDVVLAPDLLGYGFSDKPPLGVDLYNAATQASIVERLLVEQRVLVEHKSDDSDKVTLVRPAHVNLHLLTHDYGDTVAQELLSRALERRDAQQRQPRRASSSSSSRFTFSTVALLNGGLFAETHRPVLMQRLLLHSLTGPLVQRAISYRLFARSIARVFGTHPGERAVADMWHCIRANDGLRNYHSLIQYITERSTHRERWVGALQRVARDLVAPMTIINGPADPVSGAHMVERFRQLIVDADEHTVVLGAHVGHFPQLEAPADVARAYLAFVGDHLAAHSSRQ